MRYLLILLITLSSWTVKAEDLDLSDQDKQKHMAASAVIASGSYVVYRYGFDCSVKKSFWLAVGTSLAIGVAKELSDPVFSNADLAADGIGTLGGVMVPLVFEF